ncbi:MAG: ABC transporter substrate binding protein [Actinomycetota bacterium]
MAALCKNPWLKRCVTVALVLCGLMLVAGSAMAAASRVLYINSYHRGYKWSDDIEQALMSRLRQSGRDIELSVEYLDSRRFDFGRRKERHATALGAKLAGYPLDLVVVSDNAAFDFAVQYRSELFPEASIVFCGYNNFRPSVTSGMTNITGINEEVDLTGSVDLALATFPATTTLAFISSTGDISSAQNVEPLQDKVFPKYAARYRIVEIRDASLADIRKRLAELPETTVVFLAGQTSDKAEGRDYTPVENGRLIAPLSPFPVFTFWDFHLGTGVLAGQVLTGADQGRAVADMALRVLGGTRADDIPVEMRSPTSSLFDWPAMQRFRLSPDRLPPGSVIPNQTFSAWEIYRWEIGGAALIIVLETILITALVRAMLQRRLAMAALTRERDLLDGRVAERTAELQQFAYVASHDMREPLRMISSYLGLLEKRIGATLDTDGREFLAFAKDGAVRLDNMILALLDYSRLGRGSEPMRSVALGSALATAVANLGIAIEETGARIDVAGELPEIMGDRSELVRLFQNLLGNAVKYRDPGRVPTVTVSARPDGATWVLSVADNGVGIPADQTERIFGIFQRLHGVDVEGCGIGLASCRRIVEHHGGHIWVESEEGKGSTFLFTLPADQSAHRVATGLRT